ncbi:methyl-accepting chemotaxis protein [Chthonobacter albigriseus]|uniref:methyl-accepting chemotaxis protein n=1 Tax=Chthonobacter albigriseus TaxID=1683161 RepID=UPI0015EE4D55|nr:methyl-accepting chemotaxis protein [Chthonobacter albigriseus]
MRSLFQRRSEPKPSEVLPVVAAAAAAAPTTGRDDGTLLLIEEDIARTRAVLSSATQSMTGRVDVALGRSEEINRTAVTLVEAVDGATATVNALTHSFRSITEAGREISGELDRATGLATVAQEDAARVGAGMRELGDAISAIEAVVGLIAKVTKQTTLLALNATIEAERAGSAGRGFAVVASEVKALSVETQKATEEIRANIARLQSTARQSIGAVGHVVDSIERITPAFGVIAKAVEAQGSVIGAAAGHAEETRTFIDTVSSRASEIAASSEAVSQEVRLVSESARQVSASSDRSSERLMTMLRQSPAGDRRRHDRFPAERTVRLARGSAIESASTVDVSEGGLLIKTPASGAPHVGETLTLDLDGAGRVPARVVGVSPLGVHVCFQPVDETTEGRIAAFVAGIRMEYQALIERATQAAGDISALLEMAIARGEVRTDDLFDVDYQPIPGSDPVQFRTRGLGFLESRLAPMQEALLATDSRMAFCAAVDRNGYLPVHNAVFSKPQRPGETAWNTANCRNRRIFDDRTGLLAARNTRPFLIQAYRRDMGNGQIILMKEVDAPITVAGRHWGGFRMAYKL